MHLSTSPRGAATTPPAGPAPGPLHYVPLPRRLAEDLRDSPLAVGVYALIARLHRVTGLAVPLSPADLQALDPSLSYGAATRALRRLADSAYVIVARGRGRKSAYTPAWGIVKGVALPWDLAAPSLGRPRHIPAVRLDQRLFDLCLGRLRPHPEHPAVVERYVAAPLVTLADVGGYALALAGLPAAGEGLRHLGLLTAQGLALPLPEDAAILAVASQRVIAGEAAGLTAAGWARTAFAAARAEQPEPQGAALFFVPEGQIGMGIGEVIAHPITADRPLDTPASASPCAPAAREPRSAGSHGSRDEKDTPTTTAPPAGGGVSPKLNRALQTPTTGTPAHAEDVPEPASAQLLQAIGVRHSVRRQLAAHPAAQVAHVIAQARARGDVRDLAAWVVSALRDLPVATGARDLPPERPPSVAVIHTYPGLTPEQRECWIRRFHAAATPAEKRAVVTRLEQEHPR